MEPDRRLKSGMDGGLRATSSIIPPHHLNDGQDLSEHCGPVEIEPIPAVQAGIADSAETMAEVCNSCMNRGPLLIVSGGFPPLVSGSSIVNRNLWSAWPPEDLVAVSYVAPGAKTDPNLKIPGLFTRYIEPWPFASPRLASHLDSFASLVVMRAVVEAARATGARAIWAHWPTTAFVIGAWLAARKLGLPYFIHLHDTWAESYRGKRLYLELAVSEVFEGRLLKNATRVFTLTEQAKQHYLQKHGIDSFVLHHCIPDADLVERAPAVRAANSPAILHYAGSIYPLMNLDALVSVVRALDFCRHDVVLDCYTPSDPVELMAEGIAGPRVRVKFGSKDDVMRAQRLSDIVIMPLAFQSSNPVEIRTVFPTKLLEYFVSERPILVHAPADSWASVDAQDRRWGLVVDTRDPVLLAGAIDQLLEDGELRKILVRGARIAARERTASTVAAGLQAELERLGCGPLSSLPTQ